MHILDTFNSNNQWYEVVQHVQHDLAIFKLMCRITQEVHFKVH